MWGSKLLGERWYRLLHSEEVPSTPTRRQTVSHSHVLPPELRTEEGAYGVLMRLVHKAAARMRKIGYWCGAVSVGVSFMGSEPGDSEWWEESTRVPRCCDTPAIVAAATKLWELRLRDRKPFKVAMVLSDLVPARVQRHRYSTRTGRARTFRTRLDTVNSQFGASVVYLGAMFGMRDAAPTRIAFTQIPDFDKRVN